MEEEQELRSFELLMSCGQAEGACELHNALQETIAALAPKLRLAAPAIVAVVVSTVESLALNLALNAKEQGVEWDDAGARAEIVAVVTEIMLGDYVVFRGASGERLQ